MDIILLIWPMSSWKVYFVDSAHGVNTPGEGVAELHPEVFVGGNHLHSFSVHTPAVVRLSIFLC